MNRIDVALNVFAMVRPDWPRSSLVGSISVLITEEDIIVFDSGNSEYDARQVNEEIKETTKLPAR